MLPSILTFFLSSLLLSLTPLHAQLQTYNSAPIIAHTFDVEVVASGDPTKSSFQWSRGLQPHEGMLSFNGFSDYIDLYEVMDDYGRVLPHVIPSRSMSFEWWVKWKDLNTWSKILDCGNGPNADNIVVSNVDNSRDLRADFYYDNSAVDAGLNSVAFNAITVNSWQHVVVTVRQKRRYDYDSPDSAEISIYVDGRLYSQNPNTWLPRNVSRAQCYIGLSEWYVSGNSPNDGHFSGWLDDFFVYDYPLSQEAILAHYVLPRPPIYELTFSSDPRLIQSAQYNYTYSYSESDPRDSSEIAKFHAGFLNLTGDQHIDLQRRYGNESVGVAPPPIIGGMSGGNGTLDAGWSFEILFKPLTIEQAKFMDFGNGQWTDNIILGYSQGQGILQLEIFQGENQKVLPLINGIVLNRWYHIIVVLRPLPQTMNGVPLYANVTSYIDGVAGPRTTATQNFPWPAPVHRNHSYIGKSHWNGGAVNDQYFDALLDTFRIYDYALLPSEAASLYQVTHEELPRDANVNQTQMYSYHTGPVTQLTFSKLNASNNIEGTQYVWNLGDSNVGQAAWPHKGLAVFNGNRRERGSITGHYINLWTYPTNSAGETFPHIVGGPMSIEVWVRFRSLGHYMRILDIGSVGGASSHNIILGQWGDTNGFMFEVYSGTERSFLHIPDLNPVGEWVHIVASVDQISRADSWSGTSAMLTMYVNGRAVGSSYGFLPQRLPRPSAYIGRSNWAPNDDYLDAAVDQIFFYDYALQAEQVAAHYLLPLPPVFELAFTKDPRPWVGDGSLSMDQFTYRWADFNPNDFISNSTQFHNGYLTLDENEYVNLSSITGPSSIGTTLPPVLFTNGRGYDNLGGRWSGWSIELLVKLNKMEAGAKIFSFSNGKEQDEVDMGYDWVKSDLVLVVYGGSNGRQGSNYPCITNVQQGRWYHIMVVLTRSGSQMADVVCYVDGQESARGNNAVYFPRAVSRSVNFLSRSPWDEDTMDMHLDTFRIYDFAIDSNYAAQLYALTTSDAAQLVHPLYTSRPILAYTFDYDLGSVISDAGDGTSYGWMARSDPANNGNPHKGVATFDGHSNFVNLLQWPDDRGMLFPPVIGGDSMAFEAWVKWDTTSLTWSRIFDMGNGESMDNILLGQEGSTRELAFHIYKPNSSEYNSVLNSINTNAITTNWMHVVASVTDLSDWPCLNVSPDDPQATYMTIHVNGRLIAQRRGMLPRHVARSFAYLGRSHWTADSLFQGQIDSFYYYDHALSTEQVNVHFRLPKPPVFDLSFSGDPRWLQGGDINQYTYAWQEYDPTDSYDQQVGNGTRAHSGHLVLTGQTNSFVNLSQPLGHSSVGTLLPKFGGRSDGVDADGNQAGWSFEMIVKLDTVARWAKFIDWGQPADVAWRLDNVQFGYAEASRALEFRVYNAEKGIANDENGHTQMTVVPNVVLGQWYHIVVTLDIESVTDYLATWNAYVDGVLVTQPALRGMYLPRAVTRPSALIGASNWINSVPPDSPFAAKIDAIRVYDYSLSRNQVDHLHRLVTERNYIPNPYVTPNEPVCYSPPPPVAPSTAAPRPSSSSSSTSAAGPTRSVTSSSSSLGAKCKWWATGKNEPYCKCFYGGKYPNGCYCDPYGTSPDEYYPYCADDDGNGGGGGGEESSSSTGVASAASGPSSPIIAGVVVAILFVAAAAGFVYFRYFRTPPKGSDDHVALLGAPPAKFATTSTNGHGSVPRDTGATETNGEGEYYRHTDASDKPAETHGVELL